ncbi:MAG TPA: VWA domain-containing protein [Pyrinomonadaceae bacterium]|nr:VWA domain-containing protein [Pyrinomonadaceae bacterium]
MRQSLFATLLVVLLLVSLVGFTNVNLAASEMSPACEAGRQRQIALNVQDKEGKFVSTLTSADLTLTVDNSPAEILNFEMKQDQPLSVVLLVDTSVSQDGALGHTILGAQKFIEWHLKSKKDQAALVTFSGDAVVEQELTDDWPRLRGALTKINIDRPPDYLMGGVGRTPPIHPRKQGLTFMWNAVWASTDGILKSVNNSRRVMIVFSDGEDSSSVEKMRDTIQFAAVNDVAVFGIGITTRKYYLFGRTNLTDLSEHTGGRAFFLKKVQDLPGFFSKIDQSARSHYFLTYCAAAKASSDAPSKVKIEIQNRELRQSDLRLLYPRYRS